MQIWHTAPLLYSVCYMKCGLKTKIMFIKLHKGKSVKKGRTFGFYKCSEFTLISLFLFHIRICRDKETYDNLPQAG